MPVVEDGGLGMGAHFVASSAASPSSIAPGQLRLLDRLLGHRRRAGLDRAVGEEAGGGGDQQEERRLDEEAGPDLAVEDLFVEQPGDPLHDQDQRQEGEGAGGDRRRPSRAGSCRLSR